MTRVWHWCAEKDGKPILRDGRSVVIGEQLSHEGPIEICASGYHASRTPLQALNYAPGTWACLVEVEEVETEQPNDKLVARRRTVIQAVEARAILLEWSRWCALQVVSVWDCPSVVLEFLQTGKNADAAARAARAARAVAYAARAAADAADAAADAAYAAYAAHAAAYAATDVAADAARAAARAADACNLQNQKLEEMLTAAMSTAPALRG